MKHLKTYEDLNITNGGKYLVIRASNKLGFLLLKITNIEKQFVYFKILYKLSKGKISKLNYNENLTLDVINKRLVLQTDDLSEAIDKIEMYKNTYNYNL